MAFTARARGVSSVAAGDELFLMTTRRCFGSPGKDRTRIVGKARVTSAVVDFDETLDLAGRTFDRGCDLSLEKLVPFRTGVEIPPLVPRLDAFPNKEAWFWMLRRPLLRLSAQDAGLLSHGLTHLSGEPKDTIPAYLQWIDRHPNGYPKPLAG